MGFGPAQHDFIFDQYQSTALFRSGATVLFISNGWDCRPANHHPDDGIGDGGGNCTRFIL